MNFSIVAPDGDITPDRLVPDRCVTLTSSAKPDTLARVNSVELARGLAALAVCFFHFTKYTWSDESVIRQIGSYGWAGVESFFVISGFIIPFAMHRSGYRLACFFRFMTKRYLRIAPPYIAAVVIALILWFAGSRVSSFQGEVFRIEPDRLAAHLFFANDILGFAWLNPVFWTLAIEFQYYIAMAILFPLLFSQSHLCNVFTVTALMLVAWLPGPEFLVSNWVLIFLAGIVMAQWQLQCLSPAVSVVLIVAILTLILWHHGPTIFIATLLTQVVIVWSTGLSRVGRVLGHLSYSLYLMHVPVGGRVVNLGMRYVRNDLDRWFVFSLAFAASFAAAWLLWITVERSALKWSSRIKYRTL